MPPEHQLVCLYISHFPPLSFLLVYLWALHIYIQVQGHFTFQPENPSRGEDFVAGTLACLRGGEGSVLFCGFSGVVLEI